MSRASVATPQLACGEHPTLRLSRWLPAAVVLGAMLAAPDTRAAALLGSAQSFAVLGAATVTNTGATTLNGNLGVYPGTAITGLGTVTLVGASTVHATDGVALLAQADSTTAFNALAALPSSAILTGQDLGGLVLTPGVYFFASSAQLTGALTLDAQGQSNAQFVFQIGSTLTTASASSVNVINGTPGVGVYWEVGSSATLGTTTSFVGNIIAQASIALNTSATILCGRAIALTGAVTLQGNTISGSCDGPGGYTGATSGGTTPTDYGSLGFSGGTDVTGPFPGPSPVPEPGALALLGFGLTALAGLAARGRGRRVTPILGAGPA